MHVPFDSLNSLNPKKPNILLYILRGGGGRVLGLSFPGYVLLASQNPYPIIVYSVAICGHFVDPILITLGKK